MNSKILLLAACALTLTFVSCSGDNTEGGEQTVAKVKNVVCTMKANFYELAEIADITITYFDETGVSRSEAVTTKTWEKKFTTAKFPIKLTPTIFIKAKAGTPSKEKYELGCISHISYATILTDDTTGAGHISDIAPISYSIGFALDKFFEKYGNKDIALGGWTLNLDSDGKTIVEE